ncbi:MAG: hypothetical protein AAF183_06280 [Pseudomonadota bacterium]
MRGGLFRSALRGLLVAGAIVAVLVAARDTLQASPDGTHRIWVAEARARMAGAPSGHRRILFIGNSHTYRGDVPAQVATLLEEAGEPRPAVAVIAEGGMPLMDAARDPAVRAYVAEGWDVVVLQERSHEMLFTADHAPSQAAFSILADAARSGGAQVLVYGTWPRQADNDIYSLQPTDEYLGPKHPRDMAEMVDSRLAAIAEVVEAGFVATGPLWLAALAADADLPLYWHDGYHAAEAGAHLSALALARALNERPLAPEGWHPETVQPETAAVLRRIVAERTGL